MEPCAEHSGIVMCLKTIERDVSEIKEVQKSSNVKLDNIQEQLSASKIALETEKVEGKWRQRANAGVWGTAGGVAGFVLTKIFGKYL
jgi:hypothetical protein